MAGFISAGVILSILSGVAFCQLPCTKETRLAMLGAAVKQVCNEEHFKGFIQCEVIPENWKGDSSNSRAIRTAFGGFGGVIFATAEPSPLEVPSDPSNVSHPPDLKYIWKVTGAGRERWIAIHNEIRVAVKFQFIKDDELRGKEEENLQTLSAFGLAPARYVLENNKGPIMTDFIIMERIDGVTLLKYTQFAENEYSSMRGLEGYDAMIKLRVPGLRLLYIHIETMLLLKRLQIKHKWRHCDLHRQNVMVRKSTEEGVRELAKQLRKNGPKNGRVKEVYRKSWFALQLEARSIVIAEDNTKAYYQTDNKFMVLIDVESARSIPKLRRGHSHCVCPLIPDISLIFKHWKTETAEVEGNPHLTRMRRALKEIFGPLIDCPFTPFEEERKLKKIIKKLRVLEKKEEKDFIAHLEGKHGIRRAVDLFRRLQLRKPQQEAGQTDRLAAGLSEGIQTVHQTQARPLLQQNFSAEMLPRHRFQ